MILRQVLKTADLPQELDAHRFFVQWYGADECMVEQHRGILCFDSNTLRFATDQGTLIVTGQSLELEALTDSRAKINGQIISLSIEVKS
jgi:sporulation protein YqfC